MLVAVTFISKYLLLHADYEIIPGILRDNSLVPEPVSTSPLRLIEKQNSQIDGLVKDVRRLQRSVH